MRLGVMLGYRLLQLIGELGQVPRRVLRLRRPASALLRRLIDIVHSHHDLVQADRLLLDARDDLLRRFRRRFDDPR